MSAREACGEKESWSEVWRKAERVEGKKYGLIEGKGEAERECVDLSGCVPDCSLMQLQKTVLRKLMFNFPYR